MMRNAIRTIAACVSAVAASAALPMVASAGDTAVSQETMERIAREVATPYKVGMVIAPEKGEMLDGPMVFRRNGKWYMMYIRFDGRGYETMLAESDDLLKWRKLGCILQRGKAGTWDSEQADGMPLLLDPEWEGSNELKAFDGKYWMFYIGGALKGYETDPLSSGIAFTDDPSAVREWTRHPKNPVLSPSDADARTFERKTIFKHYVVEDPSRSLGARFVDYYKAKQKGLWQEKIGMAVSDDLVNWRRYGDKPVIDDCIPGKTGISGDPMIRRIGDVWVMFYFGCGWKRSGAFDTFACSYDLKHWTKWEGKPLIEPSEPYDAKFAHKPWVIKHNGVVYHFYCAVGDKGRGLALATSAAPKPKALVVMFDGLRSDAVENACAPNIQRLIAGKWQEGYSCAWTPAAQTVPDAVSSSAPNHTAIATGVTTAKNCVTNTGAQFVQCDYRKWPSLLARISDARPDAKTLFMYSWKADELLCPHPKVEFSYGDALAKARHPDVVAAKGAAYARDLANGWELEKRLKSADAPDATMLFLDLPDHGGHGHLGGTGAGFYPYGTAYLNAIHTCDAIVGHCIDAIAKRPTFKDEDWIIAVTSDHGGYSNTHGLLGGHATTVPLVVAGRHVRSGRIPGTPHNYDVAPTVLSHFGFDVSGMNLDGKVVGQEAVFDKERPLREGLAVYLSFNGKKFENEVDSIAVVNGQDARCHGGVVAEINGSATVSGAKGGYIGGCLVVAPGTNGIGGVCLKGSENLKFENGADFAMTMWVKMDAPQKGDALLLGNKDWRNGGNPGIALCAAKCTENVKTRGVVFNCVTPHGRKRIDVGTYDVEFGKWTFYAVMRGSDGVIRLYQGASDGMLYCICEDTCDIQLETGLPFFIGQDGTGRYGLTFKGRIDDFALWTRELPHCDVKRIYEAGRKGVPLGDMLVNGTL